MPLRWAFAISDRGRNPPSVTFGIQRNDAVMHKVIVTRQRILAVAKPFKQCIVRPKCLRTVIGRQAVKGASQCSNRGIVVILAVAHEPDCRNRCMHPSREGGDLNSFRQAAAKPGTRCEQVVNKRCALACQLAASTVRS